MGDTFDKKAPGNQWRTTRVWPPLHQERTLWFTSKGELRDQSPDSPGSIEYASDPKNPVPTLGGNNLFLARGPMDQSPTKSRKDVLRFETEPLADAMEIVGAVMVDLAVSTDGPDTDFIVKLVDVYPDGYEALVMDQAMRLRFRDGFDKPSPAEPGKSTHYRSMRARPPWFSTRGIAWPFMSRAPIRPVLSLIRTHGNR